VFIDLSSDGKNAAVTDSLGAATATTTINVGYMTTGANGAAVSATAAISVGAGTNYANTAQGLISAINSSGLGLNATFATAGQAGSAAVATATAAAGGGGATDTGIEISGVGIGASGTGSNGVGVVGSLALASGQTLGGTLSIVGSDGASHNITLGKANSTDTLANLESTINAAGYGVTASINTSTGALQFTTASSNVSVTASNLTESSAATTDSPIQVADSVVGTISVANASDTLGGALTLTEGVDALGTTSDLALGTSGAIGTSTDTLAHLGATINANTATTGIFATTNTAAIGTVGQAGYQAIGTVLTMTKGAGDLGTPAVAVKTALTTAALDNSAVSTQTATGTLGTLTVAAAGDELGGSTGDKISIMNGASTPAAADVDLSTAQTLSQIQTTINGAGDGIYASINSAGTSLTFYETGTPASTPTISASNLADTTPAGTATYAASGSGTASLGSLTVGAATDTLTGSLNITPFGSSTSSSLSLSNQTLAQVQATINGDATYGITATLNSTGTALSFAATSTDTGSNPAISNSGNIAVTTPAVVTNLTLGNVPTSDAANSTTLGTLALSGTLSGSIKLGANDITIGANNNTADTLAKAINAGNYGVTASYSDGVMTFSSVNSAMTINTGSLDSAVGNATPAAVGSMTASGVTSSSYYTLGISSTNGITDSSTQGGTGNVGLTTDSNGSGGVATISYADGAGQSLSATDLSSQTDAEAALTALNSAITDVAAQDGYIGAQINTLNSVSSVLSTQQQNVVSAQNAVQATDYAAAASNMSKYEILSQTGISALAQANSMQQEVTKLLQ
jgi:flagellin